MTRGRQLRDRIRRYARAHPEQTAAQLAQRVGCHQSTVRKHLHRSDAATRGAATDKQRYATAHQSRDPSRLAQLAADPLPGVRREIASSWRTPVAVRTRLAADIDAGVRAGAAWRADTGRVLTQLSFDPGWEVRCAVGANCHSPQRVLARLAGDPEPDVRRVVARNPCTPPDMLRRLGEDPEVIVRRAAARNTATPTDVLTVLAAGDDIVQRTSAEDALTRIATP